MMSHVSMCLLLTVLIVTSGGGGWSVEALEDQRLSTHVFYPFGPDVGDITVAPNDDGSSPAVNLSKPLNFFNTTSKVLYVDTNGAISLDEVLSDFTPAKFPLHYRMIAPYWCDVDTRLNPGRVFYRESTDNALLNRATQDILSLYSTKGFYFFRANWIFIATWYNVTYYGGNTKSPVNFFQTVLVTDGRYTFAMFNYGPMTWTTGASSGGDSNGLGGTPAQVGFNAGDGVNFFALNDSRTANIVHVNETTNAGLKGRWMFRIETADIDVGDCFKPGPDGCGPYQNYSNGMCIDIAPDFGCPSLDGPTVISRLWIEFYCAIPTTSTDPMSRFNVTFLFNGKADPKIPQIVVTAQDSNATLHEKYLKGHLGKWISCSVSSFWDTNNGSQPVYSEVVPSINSYWAGIQPSSNEIHINEGTQFDPDRKLLLQSTLPIACSTADRETSAVSNCYLRLSIRTTDDIAIRLNDSSDCLYTLAEVDWKENEKLAYNTNNPIELYAKADPFTTPPRPNNLTVEVKLSGRKKVLPGGDEYDDPWTGYILETIWVYHVDTPVATCRASGDPNLVTFDQLYYATYASGQFTYIQTTHGTPIEVQARQQPCGPTMSCVCGVAVREGNVILAADMCTNHNVRYITYNVQLPDGAGITVSANGATFEIKTPGGVKVIGYLRSWGMDIEIHVTASEYGRIEGLCGSFDGEIANDLNFKGTTSYLSLPPNSNTLLDFVKSWSVPLGQSLFDGHLSNLSTSTTSNDLDFNDVCSCAGNDPSCGIPVDIKNDPPRLLGTKDGGSFQIFPYDMKLKRLNVTDFFYDGFNTSYIRGSPPNITWPSTSNYTEADAYNYCLNVLWKNIALPKICAEIMKQSDIDGVIKKCVADIKMTDDLSWASDKVFEIQSLCLNSIITDNTTSIQDVIDLANLFTVSVCVPHDCFNHGKCINGSCRCDSDFIGQDCTTPKDTVPHINALLYPVCDIRLESCDTIRISSTGVASGPRLICRVDVTKWDGSKNTYLLRGRVESPDVTICYLPRDPLQGHGSIWMPLNVTDRTLVGSSIIQYDISLSNDAESFSNVETLQVIDSKCVSCQSLNCSRKDDTCIIKGYCFLDGEVNPDNQFCETCNATLNTTIWMRDPNCTYCDTPPCTGEGAIGIYLAKPKHGLASPLNVTEFLVNLLYRYRFSTNQYYTRLNIPQNFYTEVCAGMLEETPCQLRLASPDAFPFITFDWMSGLHNGIDSGCRGAVMVANTRTTISWSQRLGGVYSSADKKETSWSMFSVTDTMVYDSQLLCAYGSSSTSVPGPLPMTRTSVIPTRNGQVLYNDNTTVYSCREEKTDVYFFSISVGVPAGKTATVRLLVDGGKYNFEITRMNNETNGTTTLARSILIPCATDAQLILVDGEVDYHGKLISFTAFPYAIRNGSSVAWALYRTTNIEGPGVVTYDRWLVLQEVLFEGPDGVMVVQSSGYYYVHLSAGVHPGHGLSISLMLNSHEVLFGLIRTATNHNGVDTIGHGMVVRLSAFDRLQVMSNSTAYSTPEGMHSSFIGMLLYRE